MKKAATITAGTSKGWRFATWLILAAFTLQSYVVQTHIHDTVPALSSQALIDTSHGGSPLDNSPLDCPFCQAALSGVFALSATPFFFFSTVSIFLIAPDHPATASYDTVAHIWRSRAPPQH